MSNKLKVLDCDIIYLSYDEPNAEKNYADLCKKVPWAKRVHGVKGSDHAHKECAKLSETERFITVDGDNTIRPDFLQVELDFEENRNLSKSVISWSGYNTINGLMYGNGGLKCWPKDFVLNMRTHENADPTNPNAQVDFCWEADYIQMDVCYSDVHNNETPHQAWRAGFREGVKLSLDRGVKPSKEEFLNNHWRCLDWLYIWSMVGADIPNGLWAIYGTRLGMYKTMCTDWNYVDVRDFEYLDNLWNTEYSKTENIEEEISRLGKILQAELNVPIGEMLTPDQSKFFKRVYKNPSRTDKKDPLKKL